MSKGDLGSLSRVGQYIHWLRRPHDAFARYTFLRIGAYLDHVRVEKARLHAA